MNWKTPLSKLRFALLLAIVALSVMSCGNDAEEQDEKRLPETLNTAVRVSAVAAEITALTSETAITGVLEAFRKAIVAAEVSGRVQQRLVEPGDKLGKHQAMLLLDQGKIKSSYAESTSRVEVARVNVASAKSELVRGKNLAASSFISKDDLEALEFALQRAEAELNASKAAAASARRTLSDTKVIAPFAGTAEVVHVQEGDYVQAGAAVVTVADFSRLRVTAGVTAGEAAILAGAEKALISVDALGTRVLEGKVHSVGRIADAAAGTYPVEIWLAAPDDDTLREGMVANITLSNADAQPQLRVPAVAVFRREGRMRVFKLEPRDNVDYARLTPVRVGRSSAGKVEILDGLTAGDRVVVDGLFALRDGAPVIVRTNELQP